MFLNFKARIEVPDHIGEKAVPHLRGLLSNRIDNIYGYPQITYEGVEDTKFFETIEKDEWYAGRIEL